MDKTTVFFNLIFFNSIFEMSQNREIESFFFLFKRKKLCFENYLTNNLTIHSKFPFKFATKEDEILIVNNLKQFLFNKLLIDNIFTILSNYSLNVRSFDKLIQINECLNSIEIGLLKNVFKNQNMEISVIFT